MHLKNKVVEIKRRQIRPIAVLLYGFACGGLILRLFSCASLRFLLLNFIGNIKID